MSFKAIVFDLDDTLYPERSYTLSGFRAVSNWVASTFGLSDAQCFTELSTLFDDGFRVNTFDRWLASKGLNSDGHVDQMVAVFREHVPDLGLDESVAALLANLRERYALGLITDGHLEVQRKKVAALGLEPYFDVLVFSDEFGRSGWKPSVRPFEAVLYRLGLRGVEAVYVADNPAKDFFGARISGLATVRLRRRNGVYGELEARSAEWAPDSEIDDLIDLEVALAALGAPEKMKGQS